MFEGIKPMGEESTIAFTHTDRNYDELGHTLYVTSFKPNGTVSCFASVVVGRDLSEMELFGEV